MPGLVVGAQVDVSLGDGNEDVTVAIDLPMLSPGRSPDSPSHRPRAVLPNDTAVGGIFGAQVRMKGWAKLPFKVPQTPDSKQPPPPKAPPNKDPPPIMEPQNRTPLIRSSKNPRMRPLTYSRLPGGDPLTV